MRQNIVEKEQRSLLPPGWVYYLPFFSWNLISSSGITWERVNEVYPTFQATLQQLPDEYYISFFGSISIVPALILQFFLLVLSKSFFVTVKVSLSLFSCFHIQSKRIETHVLVKARLRESMNTHFFIRVSMIQNFGFRFRFSK